MCGVEFISNVCDVSIYPHLFGRDKVKQGERSCMLFALLDCEYGIVFIVSTCLDKYCVQSSGHCFASKNVYKSMEREYFCDGFNLYGESFV